jgi:hypothetical protein
VNKTLEVTADRMAYLRRLVRRDIEKHQKGIDKWRVFDGQPEDEALEALNKMRAGQDERCRLLAEMVRQTGREDAEREVIRRVCGWREPPGYS